MTYHYRKEPSTVDFARDTFEMCADLARIRLRHARSAYALDAPVEPPEARAERDACPDEVSPDPEPRRD